MLGQGFPAVALGRMMPAGRWKEAGGDETHQVLVRSHQISFHPGQNENEGTKMHESVSKRIPLASPFLSPIKYITWGYILYH